MTTMRRDPLVDDYLRRLEAAAAGLPRDRRAELVGEIEEHVEAALDEAGDDEAAVRNVLERRVAELDRDPAPLLLGQPVGVDAGERAHEHGLPVVDVAGGAERQGAHSL